MIPFRSINNWQNLWRLYLFTLLRGVSNHCLRVGIFLGDYMFLRFLFESCCGLPKNVEFEDNISILGLYHWRVATLGNRLCFNWVRKKAILYLCILEEYCFKFILWLCLALNTLANNLLHRPISLSILFFFNRLKSHLIFIR